MLKFNEDFIKNYDEDCGKGYFLKVDVEFPIFNVMTILTRRNEN